MPLSDKEALAYHNSTYYKQYKNTFNKLQQSEYQLKWARRENRVLKREIADLKAFQCKRCNVCTLRKSTDWGMK